MTQGGPERIEVNVVYCPDCREEIDRVVWETAAQLIMNQHHHEDGHEPGIISGHFTLEEEDDGE